MIDTFSILFTTGVILLVLVRAVQLDRLLPWFEARPEDSARVRLAALAGEKTRPRPGARAVRGAGRGTPPSVKAGGVGSTPPRGARRPGV